MAHLLRPFAGNRALPLATRLIERFGTPAGVLFATSEQLDDAAHDDGDVCRLITAARDLVEVSLREELRGTRLDVTCTRFLRYLRVHLGAAGREQLYIIYTDSKGQFLRDETLAVGSVSEVTERMAVLFRRALDLRASGLLLAHNHPSGVCRPSRRDVSSTKKLKAAANSLDLKLLDHLVVTRNSVFSIFRERML